MGEGKGGGREARVLEVLLGIVLVAECALSARLRGITISPDGVWFIAAADVIRAHHFNVFAMYREMPTNPPAFCYTLLPFIMAAVRMVAGASWMLVIVAFNAAATAVAGVLTFRIAYRWVSRLGAFVVAAGYVCGFEIIEWSRYILTDSLFLGIATIAMYLMITAVLRNAPARAFAAAGVIALAIMTRPVAPLLLIPLVLVGAVLWRNRADCAAADLRRLTLRFIALAPPLLVAATGAIAFIAARHLAVPQLAYVITLYKSGAVIVGRPEMWVHPGSGFFIFFMTTMLRRLFVFFAISASNFGAARVLVYTFYFVPLYVSAAAGVAALFLGRRARETGAMVSCVVLVMACAIWLNHAVMIIDFEWRYRLPVMPALLLLSAFGVTEFRRKVLGASA